MHIAITGASSGIGEALARKFGTEGNRVTLVARREELLNKLAGELEAQTSVHKVDLSELDGVCGWVDEAEATLGPIDVLINNAGIQWVEPTLALSVERAELLMRLNLMAPLRLIRRVAPEMVERGHGHIVNISSMSAVTFAPGMADYSASKAGLAAASETLNDELKPKGVHVLTVYPGPVRTAMESAARDKFKEAKSVDALPTGTAGELADKIAKALDKRSTRLVYPGVYGLTRHIRDLSQWATNSFAPRLKSSE
jgi:short-subunit dehydrogenase